MKTKICPKCKIDYLLTAEFWHRNRRTKSGFKSWCKKCRKKDVRKYHKRNVQMNMQKSEHELNEIALISKTCLRCKVSYFLTAEFWYKDKRIKNGIRGLCKMCINKNERIYRQKPEVKEKNRIYYQKGKERRKKYLQKPEVKERNRIYNQKPEVKERRKEIRNKYLQKLEVRKMINKKKRERRTKNLKLRFNGAISSMMSTSLKGKKAGRSWEVLVGYTIGDLMKYLERQFDDKMNWDNYGSYWHIDHIKPISLFNYIMPEDKEFKLCWELSNLQPLEKIENIKKSNKVSLDILVQYLLKVI